MAMHTSGRIAARVGLVAALLPFVLLAAFNHPFFDDYRNAYWLRAHGAWGVQAWLYQGWTGRFATTALLTLANPMSYNWPAGVKLVAATLLLLHWLSLRRLLRTLAHLVPGAQLPPGAAGWVATLLLVLLCAALPAPFSFLYWFAGAVVYQVPHMALLNVAADALQLGWAPRPAYRRHLAAAGLGLLLAVAGNELVLLQTAVVLAGLAAAWPRPRRRWLLPLLALAAALALLTLAAPGNWLRADAMAPDSPAGRWLLLLPRTAHHLLRFVARPLPALSLLAAALLGLYLGGQQRRRGAAPLPLGRRHYLAGALGYLALNTVGFGLFALLVAGPPLARALNEILLLGLLSTMLGGWLWGRQAPPRWQLAPRFGAWGLGAATLALALAGQVPAAWAELLFAAPAYDAQQQARHTALLAARRRGAQQVVLPLLQLRHARVLAPLRGSAPPGEFELDIAPGCQGTINGVLARYYGLGAVCGTPAPTAGQAPRH